MDETLARPVSVLTFAPGYPLISQVVTAARAASRLTDPRLAQVFDVEDGGDYAAEGGQAEVPPAYVVLEWVGGETLRNGWPSRTRGLTSARSAACSQSAWPDRPDSSESAL